MPVDVLSKYEICAKFVELMKQFFPNIIVFGSNSNISEVVQLHTSYMWIFALNMLIFGVILQYYLAFYTDKHKKLINEYFDKCTILFLLFGMPMSLYGIYEYFTGDIIISGLNLGAKSIKLDMNSRFHIWKNVLIFQYMFNICIIFMIIGIFTMFLNKKLVKRMQG